MKYETSAGGVIVTFENTKPKILLLKDKNGQWTFPKGLIEKNEDRAQTAAREIGEEVGLTNLKLLSELYPIEYFYRWEGTLVKKKVYYYLFEYDGKVKPKPQRKEGILDVKWFTIEEAGDILGYKKTNQSVVEEVFRKLEGLGKLVH